MVNRVKREKNVNRTYVLDVGHLHRHRSKSQSDLPSSRFDASQKTELLPHHVLSG